MRSGAVKLSSQGRISATRSITLPGDKRLQHKRTRIFTLPKIVEGEIKIESTERPEVGYAQDDAQLLPGLSLMLVGPDPWPFDSAGRHAPIRSAIDSIHMLLFGCLSLVMAGTRARATLSQTSASKTLFNKLLGPIVNLHLNRPVYSCSLVLGCRFVFCQSATCKYMRG